MGQRFRASIGAAALLACQSAAAVPIVYEVGFDLDTGGASRFAADAGLVPGTSVPAVLRFVADDADVPSPVANTATRYDVAAFAELAVGSIRLTAPPGASFIQITDGANGTADALGFLAEFAPVDEKTRFTLAFRDGSGRAIEPPGGASPRLDARWAAFDYDGFGGSVRTGRNGVGAGLETTRLQRQGLSLSAAAVPEPGMLALLAVGGAAVAAGARRRRRAVPAPRR